MTLAIYASSLFSLYHNQPFSFFGTISDSRRMACTLACHLLLVYFS